MSTTSPTTTRTFPRLNHQLPPSNYPLLLSWLYRYHRLSLAPYPSLVALFDFSSTLRATVLHISVAPRPEQQNPEPRNCGRSSAGLDTYTVIPNRYSITSAISAANLVPIQNRFRRNGTLAAVIALHSSFGQLKLTFCSARCRGTRITKGYTSIQQERRQRPTRPTSER